MFIAFLKCFCLERLSADNCYVAVMAEGVAVGVITRSARRARRRCSSFAVREIVGAEDDVLEIPHSDDDTFFEGDVSSDSSSFSEVPDETNEPSAKVPRLADDWSESEVEDESEPDDDDDVSEQNDGAEESTAEMTVADIERAVAEGCGCRNENHFSALPAQSIVTIQRQVREAKSRDKDIFLLGMLTAGQHEEEIAHAGHSASAARRERVTFRYIVKG